ncbi:transcriptional regulator [Streptomyces sp. LD120]|uniref:Transcriptional regulator n=1 Tax=Streptomyces physcomitrii TaxID=2724184 RepID=A0ABX1H6V4_9ACTN|nr:transcriptional regulator [Streptomyces physcomitrii]
MNLSKSELARTLGVSAATVRAWEQGRDPEGRTREKYAYFLDAAHDRLAALTPTTPAEPDPAEPDSALPGGAQIGGGEGELGTVRPCVLCGGPARHQVEGFPQHLTPEECTTPAPPTTPAPATTPASPPAPEASAPGPATTSASPAALETPAPGPVTDPVLPAAPELPACATAAGSGPATTPASPAAPEPPASASAIASGPAASPAAPEAPAPGPATTPEPPAPVRAEAPAAPAASGLPATASPAASESSAPEPPAAPGPAAPTPPPPPPSPAPHSTAPAPASAPAPAGRSPRPVRGAQPLVARGRRAQGSGQVPDLVADAVRTALRQHGGDLEAATAALVKKAIPDAMALLDHCRIGGRYDVVAHPPLPEILRPHKARGADQIWEARPKWTRPWLPPGRHEVCALDLNGAYLSALKTHLPLGRLEHHTGPVHDRRRAGVHLITPPDWHHDDVLPHPLGQRDEPGPLWVTEPTLRLLLRLSDPRHALCEAPVIHESFTSGASEGLLEKFRLALKDARERALAADDTVTLEYVKAMYAKFVATMGTSHYNRELYRPDWMHLIRSQAFANLWLKAFRAHESGLLVIRAMGTDELHVAGDWRRVFTEGRALNEVKVKDTYPLGDNHPPTPTTHP